VNGVGLIVVCIGSSLWDELFLLGQYEAGWLVHFTGVSYCNYEILIEWDGHSLLAGFTLFHIVMKDLSLVMRLPAW
jgi:hypothetical protein